MKKTLLLLFAAVLGCTAWAQTAGDPAKVAGTYTCDLYLSLQDPITDETESLPGMPVTLEAGSEAGTVNFAIYNLTLEDLGEFGDIVLNNIPLLTDGGTRYTFGENAPVRLSLLGGQIQADVNINTTTSYVEGTKLRADVDIAWITNEADRTQDVPIYVRVIGDRPSDPAAIRTALTSAPAAQQGVYNLSGQRVASTWSGALPHGVYIVNGKKVIK